MHLVVPEIDAEPDVAAAFAAAAAPGRRRRDDRAPAAPASRRRGRVRGHGSLIAHEAWREHAALLDPPAAGRLDPRVLTRLRDGRALDPGGRDALLRERPALQAAITAQLGDALAIWPTVPHTAPELGPLERDADFRPHEPALARRDDAGELPRPARRGAPAARRRAAFCCPARRRRRRVLAAALAVEGYLSSSAASPNSCQR